MSTEVTPESLRAHAKWARDHSEYVTAQQLDRKAEQLERESKPLPTVPGWYPGIVVERGGETCTGALLQDNEEWVTARPVCGCHHHYVSGGSAHIRWAEQDGKTPGQTLHEALYAVWGVAWSNAGSAAQADLERAVTAVLAAHGTPTLTPVGEHPKSGTRGLLPVVCSGAQMWRHDGGSFICDRNSKVGRTVLADPRPDGAHE